MSRAVLVGGPLDGDELAAPAGARGRILRRLPSGAVTVYRPDPNDRERWTFDLEASALETIMGRQPERKHLRRRKAAR